MVARDGSELDGRIGIEVWLGRPSLPPNDRRRRDISERLGNDSDGIGAHDVRTPITACVAAPGSHCDLHAVSSPTIFANSMVTA